MTGRPSIRTPELLEEICALIAQGKSIASIGEMEGMPEARTIWGWLNRDEGFLQSYTRAIQARAIIHAERIDELAEMATRGEIPPDVARVAIDAKKWTAQRLLPKLYGDRTQVDATVTHTHTLHLEALKTLADKARGNVLGSSVSQVIDVVANPTFHVERQGRDPVPIAPPLDVSDALEVAPTPPRGARRRGAGVRAHQPLPTDEKPSGPPTPRGTSGRKSRPSKKNRNDPA